MYYIVSHNVTIPKPWGALLALPMFIGPILPHIIWLHSKKKKVLRELKAHERESKC
jgi:hypothetical protein